MNDTGVKLKLYYIPWIRVLVGSPSTDRWWGPIAKHISNPDVGLHGICTNGAMLSVVKYRP